MLKDYGLLEEDMPSFTVNICVLALVLLSFQQICLSRPHSRSKRGLIKDYFEPDTLVFSSDKFEKGEDGKYVLKESAHMSDSEVKYAVGEGDSASTEDAKSSDIVTAVDEQISKPLKGEETERIVEEEAILKPAPPNSEEAKIIKDEVISKSEAVIEQTIKKVEAENEKAPFAPVDPTFKMPSKPDSKDEIPLKTDIPPVDVDEKVDEKITIGQVPHLYPRVMPVTGNFRLPVLIPIRKVSYGAVSIIPIKPSDVSDRLPLSFEDDIIGEGPHETESSHEISHTAAEEKKDAKYNPLTGIQIPFLSFPTFLKDLKDLDKQDIEKQSKVVDVLGKKFLMQSSVMKHPTGDDGHMYVRFMSVKPLEEVKPDVAKEEAEAAEKGIEEAEREASRELDLKKEAEVKEAVTVTEEHSLKKSEMEKEAEILKAEETRVKMEVSKIIPKDTVIDEMGKREVKEEEHIAGAPAEKTDVVEVKETTMFKTEDSAFASDATRSLVKSSDVGKDLPAEKVDIQILEKKIDSNPEIQAEKKEEKVEIQELEKKIDSNTKIHAEKKEEVESKEVIAESSETIFPETEEKKIEITEEMKKKDVEKTLEMNHEKTLLLMEKNKKQKSIEESEEHKKLKKKTEKKKKCKCEEKDSDSDDDDSD